MIIRRSEDIPCHRLKCEVVAALSRLSSVRRIASFGSLAEGGSDRWSDVDLFVACEDIAASPWIAAAAIRAAKPICFYRMFTGVPQPSGRYWFADESPFHRIDISFYGIADYIDVCRDGLNNGHPVTTREEYSATAAPDPMRDQSLYGPATAVTIRPHETEAGRRLYFHLEAVKQRMRGGPTKRDARETHAALARAIEQSEAASFGGGDFIGLAKRCLDL